MPFLNAWSLTAQAIEDVLDQTLPHVRLLLIDQGSTEPTGVQHLPNADARIYVWHHDPPLPSLAATWNRALRFVWEQGCERAFVINNDVRVPNALCERLLQVQRLTGAWFVTADNVGDAYQEAMQKPYQMDDAFLRARGGPDFSCFLITRECHKWFQFDEGFQPAYHEDNDYHRRLQLAGFGDRIFSVCLPYLHIGSGTLKENEKLREGWGPKFEACQRYYGEKWGGLPGSETYTVPFDVIQRDGDLGFADHRVLYTGQGKPGYYGPWKGLFDGQDRRLESGG